MPSTLSVEQIGVELRLISSPSETLADGQSQSLGLLKAWADGLVDRLAPLAPEADKNLGVVLLCSYAWDKPGSSFGAAYANILVNSGAGGVLSPWILREATIIGDDDGVVVPDVPQTGGLNASEVLSLIQASGHQSASQVQTLITTALSSFTPGGLTEIEAAALIETHRLDATAHHSPPAPGVGGVIVDVEDGRLPAAAAEMRLGWSQTRTFTELAFARPIPPTGGSVTGTTDEGLTPPPFPPALVTDPDLYFGIWIAGDPLVLTVLLGSTDSTHGFPAADRRALEVAGNLGFYYPSTQRLLPGISAFDISVVLGGGALILTESDVPAWARTGDTTLLPAAKYRAPTGTTRGAPFGVLNNDVDEGTGARLTVFLSFTVGHIKRLINRIVPAWARDASTQIPANKLTLASGGLDQADVDARVRAGVLDWAETGNEQVIPVAKIPPAPPATLGRLVRTELASGSIVANVWNQANPSANEGPTVRDAWKSPTGTYRFLQLALSENVGVECAGLLAVVGGNGRFTTACGRASTSGDTFSIYLDVSDSGAWVASGRNASTFKIYGLL